MKPDGTRRLSAEITAYEANQYFDCQEIIDVLVSRGMDPSMVALAIQMRHARALNDFLLLLDSVDKKLDTLIRAVRNSQ